MRFYPLSYYRQIEDGAVRGDGNEGSIYTQPDTGLVMHNQTHGYTRVIPAGAFRSNADKSDEIFILCASNSMKDDLRIRFEAECCVEILKVFNLRARIQARLPTGSTFMAKAISYYSKNDEIGIRWAFPDKIAFEKLDSYSWQDEYRFAFSTTDALGFGKTSQQVQIPAPATELPKPTTIAEPREYNIRTRSLRDICRIHLFEWIRYPRAPALQSRQGLLGANAGHSGGLDTGASVEVASGSVAATTIFLIELPELRKMNYLGSRVNDEVSFLGRCQTSAQILVW